MPDDSPTNPWPQSTRAQEAPGPAVAAADESIPGFELRDEIGRGGMGIVYRAFDTSLHREVAVKILHSHYAGSTAMAARFVDESRITSQLQHPGIPAVYQVGICGDGRPYLAMKLIKGQTLSALLKSGEPVNVLAILEAMAQAVGYAHAHGVIHRDLKPQNVMVGAFGEVQVMDWGLAKHLGAEEKPTGQAKRTTIFSSRDSSQTQAGSVLGTPTHMAPEQATGIVELVDERSDVFGLGAILCQMLTGEPPFAGEDFEEVRERAQQGQMEEALARIAKCAAEPELKTLCRQCLSVDPGGRPMNAGELASRVAALREAAEARARQAEMDKARVEVRAMEQRRRRRVQLYAACAIILVCVGGATAAALQWQRADRLRLAAEANEQKAIELTAAEREAREGEKKQKIIAQEAEADMRAYSEFFERSILSAARPKGVQAGVGTNVTLAEALAVAEKDIPHYFAKSPRAEALARHEIGVTWRNLGRTAAAIASLERAVALRREHFGPKHVLTLDSLNSLGVAYQAGGQSSRAIPLFEDLNARQKEVLGPDERKTMITTSNLAQAYEYVGERTKAQALYEDLLERQTRKFGAEDGDTLSTRGNYATCLRDLGQYDRAAAEFEAAAKGQARVHGPEHAWTLLTRNNLAHCLKLAGQRERALALFESIREPHGRAYGVSSYDNHYLLNELAVLYREFGQPARAIAILEQVAADVERRKFSESFDNTMVGNLIATLERTNNLPRAEHWRRKVVASVLAKQGAETIDYVWHMAHLGSNLIRQGKGPAAEMELRTAWKVVRVIRPNTWLYAFVQALLGESLALQEKWPEAEQFLIAGSDGLLKEADKAPGMLANRRRETILKLVELYEATNRPDKAAEWKKKVPKELAPPPRGAR